MYKGIQRVYKGYTKGIQGVYKGYIKGIQGYTKGMQGFIGYSQDIISSLT